MENHKKCKFNKKKSSFFKIFLLIMFLSNKIRNKFEKRREKKWILKCIKKQIHPK